nr:hypothetical protein [Tanacetum cinerariifolium]
HLALQLPEHLFFVVKREKEILFDFLPFKGPYKIVSKRFLDYLQTTGLPENYEVARLTVVSHTGKSLSEQGYFALRFASFDDALVHFEEGSKRDVPMLKNRFVYDTIHATETTDREVFVVDNFCYQETLLVTEKAKTAIQEMFYRSAIYSAAAFSTAYRQDNEWLVFKQLFEIEGDGGEQHRFMGTAPTARKAVGFRIVGKACCFGLVFAENGNPGRDAPRFEQGALVQGRDDTFQQYAIAAVGEISLDMADEAVAFVHGHAAQVVKGAHLPRLDGDAGVGLAGAADGRVPGQVLVHLVAQKIQNIEAQAAVLHQAPVADQIFQAADEHQLEKDDRVERRLTRVAVEAL